MISNSSVVFDQVFPNTVLAKKAGINSSSTTSTSASGILPSGKMGSKLSTEPPTRPPSSSLNNEKILSPPPPPKVAVNQLPVANAGQPKTVKSGDIVTLDGSGSFDPDGDRLRYFWTGISLSNANTPNPTFIAPAVNTEVIYTFHLVVNDGKLDSTPSTVNIIVKPTIDVAVLTSHLTTNPSKQPLEPQHQQSSSFSTNNSQILIPRTNHPPVAIDQSITTNIALPVDITLKATDQDKNDNLQAAIVSQPQHGSLGSIEQTTGKVTYTPSPSYVGDDSFAFKINDGKADSNTATVKIMVQSPSSISSTPLIIINTQPSADSNNVILSSSIKVSFNKPVLRWTLTSSMFTLRNSNGTSIPGTVHCCDPSTGDKSAAFIPSSSLSSYTKYTATVTTGVKATDGSSMISDYSWSFTTASIIPLKTT